MSRTIAALALITCTLVAGCAADQSGATSPPDRDPGYTPTGSNIPRRAPKPELPAANSAGQSGTAKPAQ